MPVERVLALAHGGLALWRFSPHELSRYDRLLESFLDEQEKKRLERFLNVRTKLEFALCRGVLRFLLSAALGSDPNQVRIGTGAQGKPQLDAKQGLFFNISHTAGLCLIALSRAGEVGVDAEKLHDIKEVATLATNYLSPDELKIWQEKGEGEKSACFLEFWSAKEALLKAAGCGMSIHPCQVNTREILSGNIARGMQENGRLFEFRDCWLQRLALPPGYLGWLAAFQKPVSVNFYNFSARLLDNFYASDGRKVEK